MEKEEGREENVQYYKNDLSKFNVLPSTINPSTSLSARYKIFGLCCSSVTRLFMLAVLELIHSTFDAVQCCLWKTLNW